MALATGEYLAMPGMGRRHVEDVEETDESTLDQDEFAGTPNSDPAHGYLFQDEIRRRQYSSRQEIALDHIGAMRELMTEYLNLVKTCMPTPSPAPSEKEALEILYCMANAGIIERRSKLFGYSLTFLMDGKIRTMFMAVEDDEDGKFFLECQYEVKALQK